MNPLEKIGGFLLGTVITMTIGLLLLILQVHIIIDIATMYRVTLLVGTPVEILYGIIFIWNFIRVRPRKEKHKNKTMKVMFSNAFGKQVNLCLIYLIGWLLAWIFHVIMF